MANNSKVGVVCGGSAGIGQACALALADKGYNVAVLARGPARLTNTVGLLEAKGLRALAIVCDVSNAGDVMAARDQIATQLGEPDVWINAAMLTVFAPFEKLEDEEFRQVVDVTFMGQVNGTRAALRGMRERGSGSIVNIGSGLSYRSVPLQSAYCASKHAINGFTSSVRSELIHEGLNNVSISLVQLPAVNTPQFDWARNKLSNPPRPAAPVYQPEVAARAVMRAVSDKSRELLVGRSVMQLVFGDMLLPALLDKLMANKAYDGQKSQRTDRAVSEERGNLMQPADLDAGARGSFGSEASDEGIIVDADRVRVALFTGSALLMFIVGVWIG